MPRIRTSFAMVLPATVTLLLSLLTPRVGGYSCNSTLTEMAIATVDDAHNLRHALTCTGGGQFRATWSASVPIDEPFNLSGGIDLTIVGVGESLASAPLDSVTDEPAVDGGGSTPLFFVSGSSLNLSGVVLTGGSGWNGGAVYADDFSVVSVSGCVFLNNTATSNGGKTNMHACGQVW